MITCIFLFTLFIKVRAELDDIYKKLNLGEGDTRFKNELEAKGPRFF